MGANGDTDIIVERVQRGKSGPLWLFSRDTLESIPALFDEVSAVQVETFLPPYLVNTSVAQIPLFEWLAVLVGLPLTYILLFLLNRLLIRLIAAVYRLQNRPPSDRQVLPAPIRLLLLAGMIRWGISTVSLPLLARQFWSSTSNAFTIIGLVWLVILLNGWGERWLRLWLRRTNPVLAFLYFLRRAADVTVIFLGLLVGLHFFGVNLTAALAGLGVGGIAVALAAQKTLENVIGGISIVSDRALHVGDFLKWGESLGTVEQIGLRSTRIRTLQRTVLNIPNGQIATTSLEVFSSRDKFWLNPVVKLRFDTNPVQMQCVLSGIRDVLSSNARIEQDSARARFLSVNPTSFDIEVFAYVLARDWPDFLEIQEAALLQILDAVHKAGASLAVPAQMLYLSGPGKRNGTSTADVPVRHHSEVTRPAPNASRRRS
jgi:MscS family membrane protein